MNEPAKVLAIGVVLGVVAGAVVWWLRRFEVEDFHQRMRSYMASYDAFRQWEAEQGGGGS